MTDLFENLFIFEMANNHPVAGNVVQEIKLPPTKTKRLRLEISEPDESGEWVVDEVSKSGLRGRGGGGFSTGRKWRSCIRAEGDERFVICNGDEGDPGAFMDCCIMRGINSALTFEQYIG